MKILVISDLHGSLEAAKMIKEASLHHETDLTLCLGDILYHGPRNCLPIDYNPREVIEVLNSHKNILAVRGNCDSEVDQMVLNFPIMSDENILYIKDRKIFASHGHIYGLDNLPKLEKNQVFISGHTHLPLAEKKDDFYVLNPGSSSLPKQNHPKTYAILDYDGFTIYKFDHTEYMSLKFTTI